MIAQINLHEYGVENKCKESSQLARELNDYIREVLQPGTHVLSTAEVNMLVGLDPNTTNPSSCDASQACVESKDSQV